MNTDHHSNANVDRPPVDHVILLADAAGAEQQAELRPHWTSTLVDRPMAQHVIEWLAQQGVRDIDIIGTVEQRDRGGWLVDEERWGCRVNWRVVSQASDSMAAAAATQTRGFVLLGRLDTLPLHALADPLIGEALACLLCDTRLRSTGWLAMQAEVLESLPADPVVLPDWLAALETRRLPVADVLRSDSLELLFASQSELLQRSLPFIQLFGRRDDAVRMGRQVKVHPSATLEGPAFIGDHTWIGAHARIGANVVIGPRCIIDRWAVVERSTVEPGVYVGPAAEVLDSHVLPGRVVNSRLRAAVDIDDSLLISPC